MRKHSAEKMYPPPPPVYDDYSDEDDEDEEKKKSESYEVQIEPFLPFITRKTNTSSLSQKKYGLFL